jgi:4-hydroxy-4-methyl-2-oxoglutarate aldolase
MKWSDDTQLFKLAKEKLYSAVIGDIMDQIGLYDQFLPPKIRSVQSDAIIVGRAMPVLEADVPFADWDEARSTPIAKPFGLMFEALDNLKPNEVYICTGSSPNYALWGELMSTRASNLGAAGAVVDGYSRDTREILSHSFPVFSHGSYGQDQGCRGKVLDYRTTIRVRNVWVKPGDIVFGDIDGVCVVPRQSEEEVFRLALEKVSGEDKVRDALLNGMSTVDAFKKFGIM